MLARVPAVSLKQSRGTDLPAWDELGIADGPHPKWVPQPLPDDVLLPNATESAGDWPCHWHGWVRTSDLVPSTIVPAPGGPWDVVLSPSGKLALGSRSVLSSR